MKIKMHLLTVPHGLRAVFGVCLKINPHESFLGDTFPPLLGGCGIEQQEMCPEVETQIFFGSFNFLYLIRALWAKRLS